MAFATRRTSTSATCRRLRTRRPAIAVGRRIGWAPRVDAELASCWPAVPADGDDLAGIPDDEDGIEFVTPFTAGGTATIVATASRNNGYLQGWVDWNNDGDFNDVGERIITNRLLQTDAEPERRQLCRAGQCRWPGLCCGSATASLPTASTPSARRRAGAVGEVEDYLRRVPALPAVIAGTPADFDQDGDVDGVDFLAWQRNWAARPARRRPGRRQRRRRGQRRRPEPRGRRPSARRVGQAARPHGRLRRRQDVDGADFLAMQRNLAPRPAPPWPGDGNRDGRVNAADVAPGSRRSASTRRRPRRRPRRSRHRPPSSSGESSADVGAASAVAGSAVESLTRRASRTRTLQAAPLRPRGRRAAAGRRVDLASRFDVDVGRTDRCASWFRRSSPTRGAGAPWRTTSFAPRSGVRGPVWLASPARLAGRSGRRDGRGDSRRCDEAFAALADHVEWPLG